MRIIKFNDYLNHRLGEDVDPKTAQIGKLYSVLSVAPCVTTGILGQDGGYAEFVTIRASQLVEVVSCQYDFFFKVLTRSRMM